MPCVTPAWDNTPRRPRAGSCCWLHAGTLRQWLSTALARAKDEGLPFVFVNAWNEWSEGAYLEPDAELGSPGCRRRARP